MKKNFLALLMMISSSLVFSQVGISTATPLEKLHIAGASSTTNIGTSGVKKVTPTIRIDGLNSTNNTANLGANRVTPLAADVNGNLVLNSLPAAERFSPYFQNTNINLNNSTYTEVASNTITLTRPALVILQGLIDGTYYRDTANNIITDGAARALFGYIYVNGNSVSFREVSNYTNGGTSGLMVATSGLSLSGSVVLPAGTHTISIRALTAGQTALQGTVFNVKNVGILYSVIYQ